MKGKARYVIVVSLFVIGIMLCLLLLTRQNGSKPLADNQSAHTSSHISVLDACYNSLDHGAPRTAIGPCLAKKFIDADNALQQTYKNRRQFLTELNSAGTAAALNSLNQSEAAFKQFRTAECQRIADAALGGTGAGDFKQACQVELTLWRINWLKDNP